MAVITLSRVIVAFITLWIALYVIVYYWIMFPSNDGSEKDSSKLHINNKGPLGAKIVSLGVKDRGNKAFDEENKLENDFSNVFEPTLLTDPFVSSLCMYTINVTKTNLYSSSILHSGHPVVSVIIITRNERKVDLINTLISVLEHSQGLLKEIIIVDDLSNEKISDWPEWKDSTSVLSKDSVRKLINIKRPKHRLGVSAAKHFGASAATRAQSHVLVFLDAHVAVSQDWLLPLFDTLHQHPKALVYPAIDVLHIDASRGKTGYIQADNVLGAFDWALNFRWEMVPTIDSEKQLLLKRLPLLATPLPEQDEVSTSPAAPGILAVNSKFYDEIGGFDSTLHLWGQDSVEFSLRVWMCGGLVIRQPCSRVAHKYNHFNENAEVRNGITQGVVDRNVMVLAERHMLKFPAYKEAVYQARFTGRVPYTVDITQSDRHPANFLHVKMLTDELCQSFDWFAKEVYPGLIYDMESVAATYQAHVESNYLEKAFREVGLFEQYEKKESGLENWAVAGEAEKLIELATKDGEPLIQNFHDSYIPKKFPYVHPNVYEFKGFVDGSTMESVNKERIAAKAKAVAKKKAAAAVVSRQLPGTDTEAFEVHAAMVRETLICDDRSPSDCAARVAGDSSLCLAQLSFMQMECPKSCGLCGSDGMICFDLQPECAQLKLEGACLNKELTSKVCRKTCGFCQLSSDAAAPVEDAPVVALAAPKDAPVSDGVQKGKISEKGEGSAAMDLVDPFTAQSLFAAGSLPDPQADDGTSPCQLNGTPNGALLARIKLENSPADKINYADAKIFCGIYTMEKNHETNVKATRDTWAKRCDGFVAFSTVTDPSIPSVAVIHEGEEAYDNMWQKSRTIWKYIAAHFSDQFDFFVLGGDDMFYIIDNLRHFLGTTEMRNLAASQTGMFVGRRFAPPKQEIFNSGGAGYMLDKVALKVLQDNIDSPKCFPHQHGFWEDVNIANCLRVSANIVPIDTRDELKRERYHPFTPGQHLTYRIPKGESDWYPKYNPELKEGYDCCSPESISFHYVPGPLMKKLNNYVYNCNDKKVTNDFGV